MIDTVYGNGLFHGTAGGSAEAMLYRQIEELMAENGRLREENAILQYNLEETRKNIPQACHLSAR